MEVMDSTQEMDQLTYMFTSYSMEHGKNDFNDCMTPKSSNSQNDMKKEWVPTCDEELKPTVGKLFDTLKEGEDFFKSYAHSVGFSVRISSEAKDKEGFKRWKYFVCSKEGFKEMKNKMELPIETTDKSKETHPKSRKRNLTREGCNAKVVFKRTTNGKYEVLRFHEGHTHELATPRKRQFLRSARKVNPVHKKLLYSYNRANVGTSKVYQMLKEQVGGYQNVGCTQRDLQNYSRDLKALLKDSDAHVFIDNFRRRQESNPSFFYAYELDADDRLTHVFWADGLSRKNYSLFGDIVSFDTTYETNKYSMIFAPFTGINQHRQSITFGAALLANEKTDSFVWLFQKFLEAMGGAKPVLIVTDQDPAMKIAIERIFDTSTHRFCMWHILNKLSEKVGVSLNGNINFNSRFKSCVWKSETPNEFEVSWASIITDFGLEKNDWLSHMFIIRSMWIPTYFRDLFLAGIMRTTSRSESENAFFCNFVNKSLSLVEFWMRFESAIEAQRQKELLADNDTFHSLPELKTNRELEKHGREVYTHKNFYIFQEELWIACMDCGVERKKKEDGMSIVTIVDNSQVNGRPREVVYDALNNVAHCTCKMFESTGIPCRHILFILRGKGLKEIPEYYILNRWTKLATSKSIFDVHGNALDGCFQSEHKTKLVSDAWAQLFKCMHLAGSCKEKLSIVIEGACSIQKQLSEMKNDDTEGKAQELETFIGSSVPQTVEIHPPKCSKTKGSGKRIKGGKEKAIEQQKRSRLCKTCGKQAYHDSRNCPTRTSP